MDHRAIPKSSGADPGGALGAGRARRRLTPGGGPAVELRTRAVAGRIHRAVVAGIFAVSSIT